MLLLIIITKLILRILKKHYVKKRLQRWQNISKSCNRGKINHQTNLGGMAASRGETEPHQRADLKLRIDLSSVFTPPVFHLRREKVQSLRSGRR